MGLIAVQLQDYGRKIYGWPQGIASGADIGPRRHRSKEPEGSLIRTLREHTQPPPLFAAAGSGIVRTKLRRLRCYFVSAGVMVTGPRPQISMMTQPSFAPS